MSRVSLVSLVLFIFSLLSFTITPSNKHLPYYRSFYFISFRRLVRSNRELYHSCPKHTKLLVAKAIVQAVQHQDPPGRFMKLRDATLIWEPIPHLQAVNKTSQALREKICERKTGRGKRKRQHTHTNQEFVDGNEKEQPLLQISNNQNTALQIAKEAASRVKNDGVQTKESLAKLTDVVIKSAAADLSIDRSRSNKNIQQLQHQIRNLNGELSVGWQQQQHQQQQGLLSNNTCNESASIGQEGNRSYSFLKPSGWGMGSLVVNAHVPSDAFQNEVLSTSPAVLSTMVTPSIATNRITGIDPINNNTNNSNNDDSNKRIRFSTPEAGNPNGIILPSVNGIRRHKIQNMGRGVVNQVKAPPSLNSISTIPTNPMPTTLGWRDSRLFRVLANNTGIFSRDSVKTQAAEIVDPLTVPACNSVYGDANAGISIGTDPRELPNSDLLQNSLYSALLPQQQMPESFLRSNEQSEQNQQQQKDCAFTTSGHQRMGRINVQQLQRHQELGQQQQQYQMVAPCFAYGPKKHCSTSITGLQEHQKGKEELEEIRTLGLTNMSVNHGVDCSDRTTIPLPTKGLKSHMSDLFTSFFTKEDRDGSSTNNWTSNNTNTIVGVNINHSADGGDLDRDRAAIVPPPVTKVLKAQLSDFFFASFFAEDGLSADNWNNNNDTNHNNIQPPTRNDIDDDDEDAPISCPPGENLEGGLLRSISSTIFGSGESSLLLMTNLKSSVTSLFLGDPNLSPVRLFPTRLSQQKQQQQNDLQQEFGEGVGGGGNISVGDVGMSGNGNHPILGQIAKRQTSLLDDFEETPMEQQLRNAKCSRPTM